MKLKFSQTKGMVEHWFYPYGMPKFFMEDGDEIEVGEDLGKKLLTEYPNNLCESKLPKEVLAPKKEIPSNYFKLKSVAIKEGYKKELGLGKEELVEYLIGKGYVTI